MEDSVIQEEYTLPSLGKVYDKKVDPIVKIGSMTTEQEMKRLGHSPYVYKMFSEIIDDCLIKKPGIPTYDLCVGDYQYLLYKLRIVTYGPEYKVNTMCPYCYCNNIVDVNLDDLKVNTYKDSLSSLIKFELPVSKKIIKLKIQTPRDLDEIEEATKELNSKSSGSMESSVLYNTMALIDEIDGVHETDVIKEAFVRKLTMRDTNTILQKAKKVVKSIGLDTQVKSVCAGCGKEFSFNLPITGEFFGPTED